MAFKRSRSRRPKKLTKAIARKKPRAARYALAKKVDSLAKAVRKNTSARFGSLQMSQQVTSGWLAITGNSPAIFCVDQFNTCLDSQTPSALNCTPIYQVSPTLPAGVIGRPVWFEPYNWNFRYTPANFDGWQGSRVDATDTGKYQATSGSYEFTFACNPSGDDTRFMLTFVKIRKTKNQNAPAENLLSVLHQARNLLLWNRLAPMEFKIVKQQSFYLNSYTTSSNSGTGPRTTRAHKYIKLNKVVRQQDTHGAVVTHTDPMPENAWDVDTGQRDFYAPLYCIISTNLHDSAEIEEASVRIQRTVRWKDQIGAAFN